MLNWLLSVDDKNDTELTDKYGLLTVFSALHKLLASRINNAIKKWVIEKIVFINNLCITHKKRMNLNR